MKNKLAEFYKQSNEKLDEILSDGCIILDANAILDLYRYSEKTRKEIIKILKNCKERLWIPNQFALEYQRNRPEVILTVEDSYKKVELILNKVFDNLTNELNEYKKIKTLKTEDIICKIKKDLNEAKKQLKKRKSKHPDLIKNDKILEEISELFENRVGDPYKIEQLSDIYKKGEERYNKEIPPGYRDVSKDSSDPSKNRKFGDLIGWFQILDKAEKEKKNVLFITNDKKEDWWWEIKGRTVGPRPELIKEICNKSGKSFHMYTMKNFLEFIKKKNNVDEKIIQEVKNVSEESENVGEDTSNLSIQNNISSGVEDVGEDISTTSL